ncbi:MAG: signal peptidase I [Chloroflexota bacterium]
MRDSKETQAEEQENVSTDAARATGRETGQLIRWAGRVFKAATAVAVGGVAILLLIAVLPSAFGYTPVVVASGSMEPVMYAGDIAVMKQVDDPAALEAGDIVAYSTSGNLVTHRIVGVEDSPEGTMFQTKGDNNRTPDSNLTPASAVVAEYQYRVPGMGFVVEFANSTAGRVLMILVPGAFLLAAFGWDKYQEKRAAGQRAAPASVGERQ